MNIQSLEEACQTDFIVVMDPKKLRILLNERALMITALKVVKERTDRWPMLSGILARDIVIDTLRTVEESP